MVVDFEGGNLSSDGGLLLLRKVDRRLNLIQRMADLIPDPRGHAYMKHTQAEMLTSRIFGIAAGYEDGNDHQHLRHDSAFQLAAGRAPTQGPEDEDHSPLASPSTLSRFENRIDDSTLLKLSELMVDIFLESYDCAPEEIILDYDATDDATHGEQGANPRFVVTNIPSSEGIVDTIYHRPRNNGKQKRDIKQEGVVVCPVINAEAFYREMYCPRGEMENRIKEQKLFLYSDRTSCTKFQANQFRLLLSSFAYVLLDGLRRLGLASTSAPRMRVDSIRLKLTKIAARVRVSCRRIRFHLCSRCPAKDLFNQVILNLCRSG